jgi:hypothetical protein
LTSGLCIQGLSGNALDFYLDQPPQEEFEFNIDTSPCPVSAKRFREELTGADAMDTVEDDDCYMVGEYKQGIS